MFKEREFVGLDVQQPHGARLEVVVWDESPGDVQHQLRRLAERMG